MVETNSPIQIAQAIQHQADRYEDFHPHKNLAYALVDLTGQINTPASIGITNLLKDRSSLTPDHITPILYSAAQYLDVMTGVSRDFGSMTIENWKEYVLNLFKINDQEMLKILKEKNVQSFIMRRYFPVKMFARIAFGDKPISVLDVGCSLNIGLQAVGEDNKGELFPGLDVQEIDKGLYDGHVTISNGLGIDLHKPDVDWVASCIWPDHEEEKPLIRDAYTNLNGRNPNIHFRKISALELDQHPELDGQFDLVIASGMLYQLSLADEEKFLQQVEKVAKPDAWFLTTDFPRGVSYKAPFSYLTSAYPIANNKLGGVLEFVKANDPFSAVIKPGKDFEELQTKFK